MRIQGQVRFLPSGEKPWEWRVRILEELQEPSFSAPEIKEHSSYDWLIIDSKAVGSLEEARAAIRAKIDSWRERMETIWTTEVEEEIHLTGA